MRCASGSVSWADNLGTLRAVIETLAQRAQSAIWRANIFRDSLGGDAVLVNLFHPGYGRYRVKYRGAVRTPLG